MLDGQVILLTGASEGIGAATARALAEQGAQLILVARNAARLEQLAASLADCPGECWVRPTDLAERAQREALVREAVARFGRVDVLINNAAVGLDVPVEESTLEEAHYLFEVNFFAPLHLTQLLLPTMRAQGRGQIVQVSSIVGLRATPNIALYCASKYALNGLADSLRIELHGSGVQVTTIYPGVTATGFIANQLRSPRSRPASFAIPPERVATVIVESIQRRSRSRYVKWSDFFFVSLARLLPGLAEWALATGFRWRRRTPSP